jgi:crotonobetainyl-CoA:carnitine CoA-transferase CaiB-like acyl-CoA transferase
MEPSNKFDVSALSGKVILDAASIIAAPLASGLLGDFGADVIKIEAPNGGDAMRGIGRKIDGQGTRSKVTNRNKRSVTIDLHLKEGRALFLDLVKQADVVITNFRLPTLKKWKLDYDDLRRVKPDIIMLHVTGFGRTGPMADLPSFAPIAEAFSGLSYISGFPDGPPQLSGGSIGDLMTGIFGAFATCVALLHHAKSGEGQLIDLALYDPLMRTLESLAIDYDLLGTVIERQGNEVSGTVPSNLYQTKDGRHVVLAASTQQIFSRICQALCIPGLTTDPRFATNLDRVKHRKEVNDAIQSAVGKMPIEKLSKALAENDVGFSMVNSAADLLSNEHIKARNDLVRVFDKNLNREVVMPAASPRMSLTPGQVRWVGPEAGQDTDLVLSSLLRIAPSEIEALRRKGVI